MTITIPSSYEICIWNGTINASTIEQAASQLIEHYTKSKEGNVEKMKVECAFKINDTQTNVLVSIRHNFRGLFSDDFKKNGAVEIDTNLGLKKKHHIKVTAINTKDAYPISLFLLKFLRCSDLITHCQVCVTEKDTKAQTIMSVGFKEDHSFSEIFLKKA